ncbi:MAG: LamG domain-containing protein [Candidatus Poribacteria bacterium]|nr:LamG domain-containing protein [Candidatus Poribacteria bacterium]
MFRFITFILSLLLVLGFNMLGSAEITEDMIAAAWIFDGNAEDISGNGFDGELQGGKFVDGKIGKAIELNGTNEWVNIPKRIGSFEEITFTHWVKCTGRENGWRVFYNVNGWKAGDIHYQLHPNNKVEFSIHSNPGGNDKFANFAVSGGEMNKWIHIATAYSAKEGKIRFYINGELDAESDWGNNPGVLDPGRIGDWNGSRQWQGLLDEFVIFNTVLSEDDIKSVMNDGIEGGLAVDPKAKLAVTWGSLKK